MTKIQRQRFANSLAGIVWRLDSHISSGKAEDCRVQSDLKCAITHIRRAYIQVDPK